MTRSRLMMAAAIPAAFLVSIPAAGAAVPAEPVHYGLNAGIDPARHQLVMHSTIQLPAGLAGKHVEFLLASGLHIDKSEPRVRRAQGTPAGGFSGINGSSGDLAKLNAVARYGFTLPRGSSTLTISYHGVINYPLKTPPEESARSFQETPGIISAEGIYLAGSTLWYPYFDDQLVSFTLAVHAPDGWQLIAPGNGVSRDDHGDAHWDSAGLVDEIELVGGPLKRYEAPAGAVQALVYLHQPDDALAAKYLEATARYIEMYRGLIGPYPYGKFALVENFWETGYGMPTFTLLGPQIIRFPFILTSSYPHEILHNWWGNSVFVDYETGNWCEGLTAYLADHMLKEQQGEGAEYRRDTLKKFRDFVKGDRDFPLTQFRSRKSAAQEAVGYGKTLMGFHMLRLRLGDDAFRKALASFYRKYRGQRASFANLRTEFEAAGGVDLGRFFKEWVTLTGAADLGVEGVAVTGGNGVYQVRGTLLQRQPVPFELNVPLVTVTAAGTSSKTIRTNSARTDFMISTSARPARLEIDPEFDVFRLPDPRETAPSIGQIFGDADTLVVLPASAPETEQRAYRDLIESWQGPGHALTVVSDAAIGELPAGKAAWLFGRDNRLAVAIFHDDPATGFAVDKEGVTAGADRLAFSGHSVVVVRRHPGNPAKAVGWIVVDPLAAASGVGRKLPHYGKYSYLGFVGTEPANSAKGEWPAADSPLRVALEATSGKPIAAVYPARKPLADLPAVFSRERLLSHVRFLASPALEGRGLGSDGLVQAGDYIAKEFAAAHLKPAGDNGGYFQNFQSATGPDGKPHTIRNIVGYLPGSRAEFAGQAVVVSAHYDHLGHGWPDVRSVEKDKIYPGADDNASGIAVLLELEKAFAAGSAPERTLVFVAFSGEEAGLLGSKYYVQHPAPVPLKGIRAVINMDTVGRLGDHPVSVLAAASAAEWPPIFRGVSFTTQVKSQMIEGASQSSDQQSFIDAGIPGVQMFSGVNLDYHRPSDTFDKIDGDGMVKVAAFVKEAAGYLAERPEPLTFKSPAAQTSTAEMTQQSAAGKSRRVSLGTVPDFAYNGPGIRVDSVVPDSPAAKGDIRAGDVVTALDGKPIKDLGNYSELLKNYSAGQDVTVTSLRDGKTLQTRVTLQAR